MYYQIKYAARVYYIMCVLYFRGIFILFFTQINFLFYPVHVSTYSVSELARVSHCDRQTTRRSSPRCIGEVQRIVYILSQQLLIQRFRQFRIPSIYIRYILHAIYIIWLVVRYVCNSWFCQYTYYFVLYRYK